MGLKKVRDCFRNRLTPGSYGQCPNPITLVHWRLVKVTIAKLEPCGRQLYKCICANGSMQEKRINFFLQSFYKNTVMMWLGLYGVVSRTAVISLLVERFIRGNHVADQVVRLYAFPCSMAQALSLLLVLQKGDDLLRK